MLLPVLALGLGVGAIVLHQKMQKQIASVRQEEVETMFDWFQQANSDLRTFEQAGGDLAASPQQTIAIVSQLQSSGALPTPWGNVRNPLWAGKANANEILRMIHLAAQWFGQLSRTAQMESVGETAARARPSGRLPTWEEATTFVRAATAFFESTAGLPIQQNWARYQIYLTLGRNDPSTLTG